MLNQPMMESTSFSTPEYAFAIPFRFQRAAQDLGQTQQSTFCPQYEAPNSGFGNYWNIPPAIAPNTTPLTLPSLSSFIDPRLLSEISQPSHVASSNVTNFEPVGLSFNTAPVCSPPLLSKTKASVTKEFC